MAEPDPRFDGVLETALYCEGAERKGMERFYSEVLGLRELTRFDDGVAYRVGAGIVLVFDRERLARRAEPHSRHGAKGPGHLCLEASMGQYEAWKRRLADRGVTTDHEASWPGGARSVYFRDPAGNLIEIADRDLWPK